MWSTVHPPFYNQVQKEIENYKKVPRNPVHLLPFIARLIDAHTSRSSISRLQALVKLHEPPPETIQGGCKALNEPQQSHQQRKKRSNLQAHHCRLAGGVGTITSAKKRC